MFPAALVWRHHTNNSCTFTSPCCFIVLTVKYRSDYQIHLFSSAGILKVTSQVKAPAVISPSPIMQEHMWASVAEYKFPSDYYFKSRAISACTFTRLCWCLFMSEASEPKMTHLKGEQMQEQNFSHADKTWVDQWRCYYLAGLLGDEVLEGGVGSK